VIPKANSKVNKGIIFAGCSFTWGQGLYYYSNLSTLKEPPPDQYHQNLIRRAHVKFMEANRFPRLVANHFNTYEYVFHDNGGSNEGAVDYWKKCFFPLPIEEFKDGSVPIHKIHQEEVSWVVFQLTQWQRDRFVFEHQPKNGAEYAKYHIPFFKVGEQPWKDMWLEYCVLNNIDIEQWISNFIKNQVLANVKSFLQDVESKGIRTAIFTWPQELVHYVVQDPWLLERFISFRYKDQSFSSIETLMGESTYHAKPSLSPELTIKWDEDSFDVTPKDHHPSLSCHKVMAENIIQYIEAKS